MLTWKHKYSLRSGGKGVVSGNSIDARGTVLINCVKQGGYMWTEHLYSVFGVLHGSGYHLYLRSLTCFEF